MASAITLALLTAGGIVHSADAQTWNGGAGAPGNWNAGGNWVGGVAPASNLNTAVIMSGAVTTTNTQNIANPMILNSLLFAGQPDPQPNAGSFVIGGSALNFVNNGAATPVAPTITNNSTNPQAINVPISLTNNLSYLGSGSSIVSLTGIIGETAKSSITVNSTAQLALSGVNTYTGGLTLTKGTLILGSNKAAGDNAGTLALNGGTVRASKQNSVTLGNPVSLGGDVVMGTGDTPKTLTFTGNAVLTKNLTLTLSGAPNNFNGNINSGVNNLTIAGTSSISTTGTVTIPATTVSGGTIWNKATWNGNVTVTGKGGFWSPSRNSKLNGTIATQDGNVVPADFTYDDNTGIVTEFPGMGAVNAMTLDSGGTFGWLFDGQSAGTGFGYYGQLDVTSGSIVLGNAALDVSVLGSQPINGDTYTLIDNQTSSPVIGTFAGLPEGATFTDGEGFQWLISYQGDDGNNVVLTSVPEPASVGLIAVTTVAMALRRRRTALRSAVLTH